MTKYVLTAVVTKGEKYYVAESPETGIVSQGKNFDEALANLREAVELYIEEFPLKETGFKPVMTVFEVNANA